MPIMSSRGAFSTVSYGVVLPIQDGTEAIFALGYNGSAVVSARDRYTYIR